MNLSHTIAAGQASAAILTLLALEGEAELKQNNNPEFNAKHDRGPDGRFISKDGSGSSDSDTEPSPNVIKRKLKSFHDWASDLEGKMGTKLNNLSDGAKQAIRDMALSQKMSDLNQKIRNGIKPLGPGAVKAFDDTEAKLNSMLEQAKKIDFKKIGKEIGDRLKKAASVGLRVALGVAAAGVAAWGVMTLIEGIGMAAAASSVLATATPLQGTGYVLQTAGNILWGPLKMRASLYMLELATIGWDQKDDEADKKAKEKLKETSKSLLDDRDKILKNPPDAVEIAGDFGVPRVRIRLIKNGGFISFSKADREKLETDLEKLKKQYLEYLEDGLVLSPKEQRNRMEEIGETVSQLHQDVKDESRQKRFDPSQNRREMNAGITPGEVAERYGIKPTSLGIAAIQNPQVRLEAEQLQRLDLELRQKRSQMTEKDIKAAEAAIQSKVQALKAMIAKAEADWNQELNESVQKATQEKQTTDSKGTPTFTPNQQKQFDQTMNKAMAKVDRAMQTVTVIRN